MNRMIAIILVCFTVMFLSVGCERAKAAQDEESQMVQLGNPWSEWNSIAETESATDFTFELPDMIADYYTAAEFRTMNNELIEIVYKDQDGNFEVCVRKQKGEGQDISGDYNEYDTCNEENFQGGTITVYNNTNNNSVKIIISYQGYSWALMAPNGFQGDFNQEFLNHICQ